VAVSKHYRRAWAGVSSGHAGPYACMYAGRGVVAFTLIEILAVLVIITILLGLGVPAIRTLLRSSEQSLAENQLRVALGAARDAALRSDGGDGAAVFVFEGGRTTVLPCVQVGVLESDEVWCQGAATTDPALAASGKRREIFVPVEGIEPIRMPQGWGVRGYVPGNTLEANAQGGDGSYDSSDASTGSLPVTLYTEGNWVFPETSFLDLPFLVQSSQNPAVEGSKRQAFMVRFEAGTGNAVLNAKDNVLVFDPLNVQTDQGFRSGAPFATEQYDVTLAISNEVFVRQMLRTPALRQLNSRDLRRILGDQSPDTILVKPVTELALYDEERLAAAIGADRVNRTTGTLYGTAGLPGAAPTSPSYDTSLFSDGASVQQIQERVNAYIERRNQDLPAALRDVALEARVFTVQRYLGQVQEVRAEEN
jgi:type II secretory pathway pseudopilin PulG